MNWGEKPLIRMVKPFFPSGNRQMDHLVLGVGTYVFDTGAQMDTAHGSWHVGEYSSAELCTRGLLEHDGPEKYRMVTFSFDTRDWQQTAFDRVVEDVKDRLVTRDGLVQDDDYPDFFDKIGFEAKVVESKTGRKTLYVWWVE